MLGHFAACAAQQDRGERFTQLIEVPVADDFAAIVDHAVAMEERVRRSQAVLIDEADHREQFTELVFERCAGEHQTKLAVQGADHRAGFRFPVFDALALVQDDQIPGNRFDRGQIAQHLLIVADREECPRAVLLKPLGPAADDQLRRPAAEPHDLAFPLALERGRADHQHAFDLRQACQQLRYTDSLNCFSQSHVIGEDRTSRPDSERNPVQLVRQQRGR